MSDLMILEIVNTVLLIINMGMLGRVLRNQGDYS